VLLTGFDPFGGASVNPSWLAVQALHGRQILGRRLVAAPLPTVFGRSLDQLRLLLDRHQPELVLCVGQAGGRSVLSLERVAINLDDAPLPDNAGAQPLDAPVIPSGPTAYFTPLPVKPIVAALRKKGLPAEVSHSAGTFVCNHVFYGLLHTLATDPRWRHTRGGFVHVPWLPEQGQPAMALGDMVRGLSAIVRQTLVAPDARPAVSGEGGATH
jgi:pyroglutamyl-peptidase